MPLVHVVRGVDGRLSASGDLTYTTGHRIVLSDGAVDGVYAGWRWDGTRLRLENDRYGLYPLYVWTPPGRLVVATDLETLLEAGAPRALDHDALAVFLRVGFFVGDDTPFRSIRALPPRPRLLWGADGARVEGGAFAPRRQALTRRAAIEAYIELFRQAMARRLPAGPFHLPLSGGRDSRHILFALDEQGCRPDVCVTVDHFPPRASDDAAVAAELCRRLRLSHVVLRQPRDRAGVEADKTARTHFCTEEHAQFVVLADHLRHATRETHDGIAGDVLSQSSYLTPGAIEAFSDGDPDAAARYVLDGFGTMVSERALGRLLAPSFLRHVPRSRAVARLAREIAPHLPRPNPVESFFFWNRTRREVALAPYGLMRDVVVYAPYLDRDLFDLLAGLPVEIEADRTLHSEAIARAYPRYADVPYESRATPPVPSAPEHRLAASLARAVVGARGVLRAPTLLPGIAASALGRRVPLWHTPLTLYIGELTALSRRDR